MVESLEVQNWTVQKGEKVLQLIDNEEIGNILSFQTTYMKKLFARPAASSVQA